MTQASAAAMQDQGAPAPRQAKKEQRAQTLEERLAQKLRAARRYRGTIRFFANRRELLSSGEHRQDATAALRRARHRLDRLGPTIKKLRRAIQKRDAHRRAAMPPKAAICDVFRQECGDAVAVAWCESRLVTTARNGQYLGLFQMGSSERQLYGHGSTAHAQAEAAHRYFVRSGRDWSPWSCKPWYAS